MIDREDLEKATLDQLQKEARKYQISVSNDKAALIEAILIYQDKCVAGQQSMESPGTSGELRIPGAGPSAGTSSAERPLTAETFRRTMSEMSTALAKQQKEILLQQQAQQQQWLQQQQQFMLQLMQQVSNRAAEGPEGRVEEAREPPQNGGQVTAGSRSATLSPASVNRETVRYESPLLSGNAAKWLAVQLSEFGGTEDEDVSFWTTKVEETARIYSATDGVTLLAATNKLVKAARVWYEAQRSPVISSWDGLRRELIRAFDRRPTLYKTLQKIESKK